MVINWSPVLCVTSIWKKAFTEEQTIKIFAKLPSSSSLSEHTQRLVIISEKSLIACELQNKHSRSLFFLCVCVCGG